MVDYIISLQNQGYSFGREVIAFLELSEKRSIRHDQTSRSLLQCIAGSSRRKGKNLGEPH